MQSSVRKHAVTFGIVVAVIALLGGLRYFNHKRPAVKPEPPKVAVVQKKEEPKKKRAVRKAPPTWCYRQRFNGPFSYPEWEAYPCQK